MLIDEVFDRLTRPEHLWTRKDILVRSGCPAPRTSGIYGWYFRTVPDKRIWVEKCVHRNGCHLLYVGIAPRNRRSNTTLRSRIKDHYRGWTTLRQTLGSLLAGQLGLIPKDEDLHWNHENQLSESAADPAAN